MFPFPMWLGTELTGVHSDLYCRTCAIDNGEKKMLIISFDLVGSPPERETSEMIFGETGILPENILITATHNHSGPFVGEQSEYIRYAQQKCLESVRQALGSMRPAGYGFGEGMSYINVNRDYLAEDGFWIQNSNYEGFCDRTLSVVKFEDSDGKLICAILNYAIIPSTAFISQDLDGKIKVSSDIAGAAAEYIENRFGNGAVVLWTSGAAGNLSNPLNCIRQFDKDGFAKIIFPPQGTGYFFIGVYGQTIAIDAIKVIKTIGCTDVPIELSSQETTVRLPAHKPPAGADLAYNRQLIDNMATANPDGSYPEKKPVEMLDDPDNPVDLRLRLITLGDIALFGINGNPYCEIGVLCKEKSPYKKTIVVTNVGKSVGYIIKDASKDKRMFTYYGRIKPGRSDGIIVGGMLELFEMMKANEFKT
jgi:hypothetical protein